MHPYALAHLSDTVLLRDLTALVVQDRHTTASLLAHIAEVDSRKLYAPAGYSSMHAYCVDELRLSEDAAYKRIQVARAARQFPGILDAIAEGRLHLSGACLLAPFLTRENAEGLLAESVGRRKSEIEAMLARRFAPPYVGSMIRPLASSAVARLAPAQVAWVEAALGAAVGSVPGGSGASPFREGDGAKSDELAPAQVEVGRTATSTSGHFLVQMVVDEGTRDKLRRAQELLSHSVPSGDVAQVIDRALDALITALEKRKIGVGAKRESASRSGRYVSARVRRVVWERDGGRCTFASASGVRCNARRFLEFDHVDPVARGGASTVDRVRLRCRAHNQLEAERAFGAAFMRKKRETTRAKAREAREQAARVRDDEQRQDLLAGLRRLGCRADEALRAAEHTRSIRGASLEDRFRAALQFLGRGRRHGNGVRV